MVHHKHKKKYSKRRVSKRRVSKKKIPKKSRRRRYKRTKKHSKKRLKGGMDAFRAQARAVTRIRAAQLRDLINQVSPSDQHNPNKIVYNIGKFLAGKKAGFGVAGSVEARGGRGLEDLQPLWRFDPTSGRNHLPLSRLLLDSGDEEKRRSFPPPPPILPPMALREAALGARPVDQVLDKIKIHPGGVDPGFNLKDEDPELEAELLANYWASEDNDLEVLGGARICVTGLGRGSYVSFKRKRIGANEHTIAFDSGETVVVKLKQVEWTVFKSYMDTLDPPQPMKVTVTTLEGKTIPLEVTDLHKVEAVKTMIEEQHGIPADRQRLLMNQEVLEDGLTLRRCGVEDGAALSLALRLAEGGQQAEPEAGAEPEPDP